MAENTTTNSINDTTISVKTDDIINQIKTIGKVYLDNNELKRKDYILGANAFIYTNRGINLNYFYEETLGQQYNPTRDFSIFCGSSNTIHWAGTILDPRNSRTLIFGDNNDSSTSSSIMLGNANTVSGNNQFTIGEQNSVLGAYQFTIGNNNTLENYKQIAIGNNLSLSSRYDIKIGNNIDNVAGFLSIKSDPETARYNLIRLESHYNASNETEDSSYSYLSLGQDAIYLHNKEAGITIYASSGVVDIDGTLTVKNIESGSASLSLQGPKIYLYSSYGVYIDNDIEVKGVITGKVQYTNDSETVESSLSDVLTSFNNRLTALEG